MPDHTFPLTGGCKLVPAGYMPLRLRPKNRRSRSLTPIKTVDFAKYHRSRSESPKPRLLCGHSFLDTTKRERIKWPRIGQLNVFLYGARYFKSTSSRHASNLLKILPKETIACSRRVLILVTDGGPDWTANSLLNVFVYGTLWKMLKLDALVLVRYAPRHSKYNMIERLWASLTRKLSQVCFYWKSFLTFVKAV